MPYPDDDDDVYSRDGRRIGPDDINRQAGNELPTHVSAKWYLLPIFLSVFGGLIAWAVLRKRNPKRAFDMLLLSLALLGIFVLLTYVGDSLEPNSSTPELTLDNFVPTQAPDVTVHRIGYNPTPPDMDGDILLDALKQATNEWNNANPALDFKLVDVNLPNQVNPDVMIIWAHHLRGDTIGVYQGTENITIQVGDFSCDSEYRQFSREFTTGIIAHELGHYLGVGHTSQEDHLMYTSIRSGTTMEYDAGQYMVPSIYLGYDVFATYETGCNTTRISAHGSIP